MDALVLGNRDRMFIAYRCTYFDIIIIMNENRKIKSCKTVHPMKLFKKDSIVK